MLLLLIRSLRLSKFTCLHQEFYSMGMRPSLSSRTKMPMILVYSPLKFIQSSAWQLYPIITVNIEHHKCSLNQFYICVWASVSVHVCVFNVYECVYVCTCMCVRVCVLKCVYVCMYICACIMYICVCVYICVHACVSLCMHVCVSCVWM
jgi:hypothetical protein